MAITKSAKKAHRVSLRRRVFNLRRKQAVSEAVKNIKKLIAEKKLADATRMLPLAYKAYDKAAKEHTIRRGAAARKKSQLARLVASVK